MGIWMNMSTVAIAANKAMVTSSLVLHLLVFWNCTELDCSDIKLTCLFHPDFDRWSWDFTRSAESVRQHGSGRGLIGLRGPFALRPRRMPRRFTASEEFHLALKQ